MADSGAPFSPDAQRALEYAERLSAELRHTVITPEHVLSGVLHTPDGQAAAVLQALGLDVAALTASVDDYLRAQPAQGLRVRALAPETRTVLREAVLESQEGGLYAVDTAMLLLGILRVPGLFATNLLRQHGVTPETVRPRTTRMPLGPEAPDVPWSPRMISPVFGVFLLLTAGAGYLAYTEALWPRAAVIVFVVGGWLISLSLHEFGHAMTAYLGGDLSVIRQGYLTLNPFRYTHWLYSIAFPLLILAIGGIGLPGGAVYIRRIAIRSRAMQSLMALAGPAASALCAVILSAPFILGLVDPTHHQTFWAGVALLAFLQVTAVAFNLLPIPPLDGFSAIEPYLPNVLLNLLRPVRQYGFLLILLLFLYPTPVSEWFWSALGVCVRLLRVDGNLVMLGLYLIRFWSLTP